MVHPYSHNKDNTYYSMLGDQVKRSNPETQATLGTRHGASTNKTKH
jgi:hypothetical protein